MTGLGTFFAAQQQLRNMLYAKRCITSAGCWRWMGSRDPNGYGKISVYGKPYSVHRVSWAAHNGPIPPGIFVLHRCDHPPCFRPDHLFLGNQQANSDDKILKGRVRYDHLARRRGEGHPLVKLTWGIVDDIRARYNAGELIRDIANDLDLIYSHVYSIVKYKSWRKR